MKMDKTLAGVLGSVLSVVALGGTVGVLMLHSATGSQPRPVVVVTTVQRVAPAAVAVTTHPAAQPAGRTVKREAVTVNDTPAQDPTTTAADPVSTDAPPEGPPLQGGNAPRPNRPAVGSNQSPTSWVMPQTPDPSSPSTPSP